jgi:hypothetical protein
MSENKPVTIKIINHIEQPAPFGRNEPRKLAKQLFCLLSSVFCLLSSVFCLLSSAFFHAANCCLAFVIISSDNRLIAIQPQVLFWPWLLR